MSEPPERPDLVRDTIVPQEAPLDDGARDTIVPQETSPFRRDPEVRARRGLALGGGVALLVAATGLVPLALVALLARGGADIPAPSAATVAPPSVDFAGLRAAIPAAAPAHVPASAAPAARAEPDASLHAFARLASRVYEAREAWRKAGQAGRELFRTATVDELGGAAFVEELALGTRRFVWLRREARVLAPAGAQVPEGVVLKDGGNDPGPVSLDGTLEGRPVRAIRTCMFGESYCLVDVVDLAPAAPAAAPVAPVDQGARLAAFDEIVAREATKLAAWAPPPPSPTTGSRGLPVVALLVAALVALALVALAVSQLRRLASAVVAATYRLRAASAGRLEARAPEGTRAAELVALDAAIDEAARALGEGSARAEEAARRRQRLAELADVLAAAAAGRLEARAPAAADDDAALAALTAGTNAALESLDARVLRWKSHAAAAAAGTGEALRALQEELSAVSTTSHSVALVGALRELPVGEIARRLPEGAP